MSHETEGAQRSPGELELIGRRLRELRKAANLSQREVADTIGLPQSNLSRIENGKQRLNLTVLARMLGIYEMTIQDFFAREADEGLHGEPLSVRERQMLEAYRRLSPDDRRDVEPVDHLAKGALRATLGRVGATGGIAVQMHVGRVHELELPAPAHHYSVP